MALSENDGVDDGADVGLEVGIEVGSDDREVPKSYLLELIGHNNDSTVNAK